MNIDLVIVLPIILWWDFFFLELRVIYFDVQLRYCLIGDVPSSCCSISRFFWSTCMSNFGEMLGRSTVHKFSDLLIKFETIVLACWVLNCRLTQMHTIHIWRYLCFKWDKPSIWRDGTLYHTFHLPIMKFIYFTSYQLWPDYHWLFMILFS